MENIQENRKIEIGQESLGYLNTTRKWTMFFTILGFVFLGIMLVFGLLFGSFMSLFSSKVPGIEGVEGVKAAGGIAGVMIFIVILVFAVIYFFPLLYLLRFSKHTKNGVANFDANELQLGFKNLKSYCVYMGILIIIVLALYLIVLIVAGSSLAFLSGLKG
jgi:energy-coupling factor transporter transmembrane protein EcfT